jgi:hypothetical protein
MEVLDMELEVLKKKLNTYRTTKGRLTRVPDELAYELLLSWEQWTGPASSFYSAIGADFRKVASLLGRAKKLKREGHFADSDFKEIKVAEPPPVEGPNGCKSPITMKWEKNKIIRFSQVQQLVEFLNIMESKKAS